MLGVCQGFHREWGWGRGKKERDSPSGKEVVSFGLHPLNKALLLWLCSILQAGRGISGGGAALPITGCCQAGWGRPNCDAEGPAPPPDLISSSQPQELPGAVSASTAWADPMKHQGHWGTNTAWHRQLEQVPITLLGTSLMGQGRLLQGEHKALPYSTAWL